MNADFERLFEHVAYLERHASGIDAKVLPAMRQSIQAIARLVVEQYDTLIREIRAAHTAVDDTEKVLEVYPYNTTIKSLPERISNLHDLMVDRLEMLDTEVAEEKAEDLEQRIDEALDEIREILDSAVKVNEWTNTHKFLHDLAAILDPAHFTTYEAYFLNNEKFASGSE